MSRVFLGYIPGTRTSPVLVAHPIIPTLVKLSQPELHSLRLARATSRGLVSENQKEPTRRTSNGFYIICAALSDVCKVSLAAYLLD